MELMTALIVEDVKRSEDGKIDLIGLFEDIYTDELPQVFPEFSVFLDMEFGQADINQKHTISLKLIDTDGHAIVPTIDIQIGVPIYRPDSRNTVQYTQKYQNILFRNFGVHYLDILVKGKVVKRLYLDLLKMQ